MSLLSFSSSFYLCSFICMCRVSIYIYMFPAITRTLAPTSCPIGKYSRDGITSCTPCAAGYYSASQGSLSCTACPLGKYAPDTLSSACLVCATGTLVNASIICPLTTIAYSGSMQEYVPPKGFLILGSYKQLLI